MENNELLHWGVRGMRWGVRRYQNADGTLTPAGKKRYNKEMEKLKAEEKVLKNKQRTQAKLDKIDSKKKELEQLRESLNGPKKTKTKDHEPKPKKETIDDLTNDELRSVVTRLELEKRYSDLRLESSRGRSFIIGVLENAGKAVATDFLVKNGKKFLGLSEKKEEDPLKDLRKTVEKLDLEKRHKDHTSPKPKDSLEELRRQVQELQLQKAYNELTKKKEDE